MKLLRKILSRIYYLLKLRWELYKGIIKLKAAYHYDMNRFSKYSYASWKIDSSQNLISKIVRECHVLEKGLTMPEPRLGFGKELFINLARNCIQYIVKFNNNEPLVRHAIAVILEYDLFHLERDFPLDKSVTFYIDKIKELDLTVSACKQRETTKENYFKNTESTFPDFAKSRSSVRNYSNDPIPLEKIHLALKIAQTTPSQCNRQCWRTYVYTSKAKINTILQAQGGNRGFGHLANKLIVIAAETGVFEFNKERNAAFVDGGMYAMNLLYALHYKKIATCILSCSVLPEKDLELRKLCGIKKSEVFIAMIACGLPQEEFKIATSKRYEFDATNTIICD